MNKEFKPFRIKDHLKKDSSVQVFYNEGLYAYKPAIFTNPIIKPNPKSDWNLEAIMEKGIPDEVPGALMFAWNVRKRNLNQIEREVPEEILENRIKAWIAGYAVGAVSHIWIRQRICTKTGL